MCKSMLWGGRDSDWLAHNFLQCKGGKEMQPDLQDSVSVANLNNAVSLGAGTVNLLTF